MPAGLLKCADGIEYPILFSLLSPLSSSTSTSARLNAMSLHHLQCGGHGPDKDQLQPRSHDWARLGMSPTVGLSTNLAHLYPHWIILARNNGSAYSPKELRLPPFLAVGSNQNQILTVESRSNVTNYFTNMTRLSLNITQVISPMPLVQKKRHLPNIERSRKLVTKSMTKIIDECWSYL